MPELAVDCRTTSYGAVSSSGFWSKHCGDVSYNQLQKFWSELSLQARQELLRIDKQTLFEQARKNMYCSRCNGLLLEGFMQIVMYGKSLQQEGIFNHASANKLVTSKSQTVENGCMTIGGNDDVIQDPSVHPWGGLTTTRDGTLTLLDCYICSKYLKGLQNVFDSARARERERELLYPDACGGGGRGWISQGMVGYGRGHGTRETCALHTARLSVDTLVDFWSALGEETRYSLLRMKEEDFMERLMYRFDSKRFCRDCRKNVIREFKELKELKRMKRETRCTSWFCVADTSFQYEVTHDTIHAEWHQTYADSKGIYEHYEWAVGTGEGKSDILDFENVGSNSRVKANGLDLTGLNSCYITLRAWRTDGRCNEVSVKAHALKGQHCVHGRLVVGDGFVTITRGESIRRFFEHAEEAEEEEDDDSVDKDGNELDGECSRPQKHAKSPELAREFLLDAATVIFKEQVEKAFREGTARQNAHSMFVSLALKLLEQRVIVACKDIITLEKQFKLLEEEEKEKRDEEERKERRRAKEKEKKLRRKERLRIKEQEKEKKCGQLSQTSIPDTIKEELTTVNNEPDINDNNYCEELEHTPSSMPASDDYIEDQILDYDENENENENGNAEFDYRKDGNQLFGNDQSKHTRRRLKPWKDYQHDQPSKWTDRRRFEYGSTVNKPVPRYHSDGYETASRNGNVNGVNKSVSRSNGSRYTDRSHCCQHTYYRPKSGIPEPDIDASKPYFRRNKYNNSNQTESVRERPKTKIISGNNGLGYVKKVWEPRSNIDSDDVTDRSADVISPVKVVNSPNGIKDNDLKESKSSVHVEPEPESGTTDLCTSSTNSNSDSCSSCLSEGDGNASLSSTPQNTESSSTSDSECANHRSEVIKETSPCRENAGEMLSKTSESVTGNNVVPPPLQAKSIHFPVFQAPSMGYYHQGPVPWASRPASGLMPLGPLPHPNHYLFASPFGYGNSPYVPYSVGGLQPPLLNHGQLPMYPSAPSVNGVKDHHTKVIPVKNEQHVNSEKAQNGQNDNSEKTQKGNTGFSLFHFGGPVDVSNGFNPDADAADCVKEEVDADVDRSVVKDVEEYNLFAASNGIQFSIF
ncbi:hypothetical protein HanXRQr2_Chr11g0511031 [Helianthus annuus]|uniref:Uncharacterized protein n=1 Tax=Helianthus annuus TaxID=4232 RepID=A0A251SIW1_HELAN|nr:uncharacterized protein LOC110909153 [Helianthus annuus]KAF5783710.1 hypothetical protein HanXRQr2_Chr11g0511031 [Helianthus annuus]KAJ0511214.1 hypothetical protein HanIR_Chr11g0549451 [Helianthus annuus]KAJ0518953.1 hypothetical protein HanHA89_Chr11g0443171 [Helianthus annuus]KAJ0876771.1 hypothetical protein HanPSC8_Chr11g0492251 [Helianthus annuus]